MQKAINLARRAGLTIADPLSPEELAWAILGQTWIGANGAMARQALALARSLCHEPTLLALVADSIPKG
jgi:hypothetical protein